MSGKETIERETQQPTEVDQIWEARVPEFVEARSVGGNAMAAGSSCLAIASSHQ
jgi:hypothetical protein